MVDWAVLVFGATAAIAGIGAVRDTRVSEVLTEVSFLDVGQGDAVLVRAPNGARALIDAGPDSSALEQMLAIAPANRSLSFIVLTHFDADHIGGIPDLLSRYEVTAVLDTGLQKQTALRSEIDRLLASTTRRAMAAGDTIILDHAAEVRFDVLWPPREHRESGVVDSNDESVVLALRVGSSTVMLTGDAGTAVEQKLLECFGAGLDSVVLKAGHHGSDTSTSPEFVQAITPVMAVISAGQGNSYGHPHETVLDTLTQSAVAVHTTKDEGRVTFVFSGAGFARLY